MTPAAHRVTPPVRPLLLDRLHDPALFSRWWLGSPSLWWDDKVSFSRLPEAAKRAQQPSGRAYVTVGSEESDVMVPPMKAMTASLRTAVAGPEEVYDRVK